MNTGKILAAGGTALAAACAFGLWSNFDRGRLGDIHPLRKAKEGQTRVACVGDSITYGCGVEHWTRNAYPAVLSRLLGSGFCVNNFGYSARVASLTGDHPYESEALFRQSLAFLPDIVVLMLGTNDSKPYSWHGAEAYAGDVRRLVRAYRELPSEPKVFLMTPPPAFASQGQEVLYDISAGVIEREIRPALQAFAAEEDLPLIDLWATFEGRSELFWDGVHPNPDGAKLLAETVFRALRGGEEKTGD